MDVGIILDRRIQCWDVPMAMRESFQAIARPMIHAPNRVTIAVTILGVHQAVILRAARITNVPSVRPASPLIFCGFSLRLAVMVPVFRGNQLQRTLNWVSTDVPRAYNYRSRQLRKISSEHQTTTQSQITYCPDEASPGRSWPSAWPSDRLLPS